MKQFCLSAALSLTVFCYAQEVPVVEQQLEDLTASTTTELQDDQYLQQMIFLKKHPLDINSATRDELQSIPFLTDLQIENLIRYRSLLGNLIDVHELQAIPCWDLKTIQKSTPFLLIGPLASIKEDFLSRFKGEQNLIFRLSTPVGKLQADDSSSGDHYRGDKNHLTFLYRYQYKNLLYFGIAADKDPGEQFFKRSQSTGFDFYSCHFFVRNIGSIKALVLGDYTVNLGQGLIQWQSMAFGKSTEVISIKKQSPVLVPYRSAGEFYFNRGLGITICRKNFEVTGFVSCKKIDGNIKRDSVTRFTGVLTSGYHRTDAEIADRNTIKHTSSGANISYRRASLKIGMNAVLHRFDIPLEKNSEPYNLYAPEGKSFFNSGLEYSYTFRNFHVFGEIAADKNLNKALLSGIVASVDPRIDLAVLYRNMQKGYYAFSGNVFSENIEPGSEKGTYFSIAIRPNPSWNVNAYADVYSFPWLRYRVNAPITGCDYLIQLNYQRKNSVLYLRYRNKNKPINGNDATIRYPEEWMKQALRFHFSTRLSAVLSLKTQGEVSWLNKRTKHAEQGFLNFVEVSWGRKQIRTDLRLQYFETGSYDSRMYAYEADVLYSYSIPAFFNKGFHYYFNLNYKYNKNFTFWLKLSQTLSASKTGADTALSNTPVIKVQAQYIF